MQSVQILSNPWLSKAGVASVPRRHSLFSRRKFLRDLNPVDYVNDSGNVSATTDAKLPLVEGGDTSLKGDFSAVRMDLDVFEGRNLVANQEVGDTSFQIRVLVRCWALARCNHE